MPDGMTTQTIRFDHLEILFRRYPDVPKEVVVKEDMLREGFEFTEEALAFSPRHKTYQLFSWDLSAPEELNDPLATVRLPDTMDIRGGVYGLQRMRTRPRIRKGSPYVVDVVENELQVCDRVTKRPVAQIDPFAPEPSYYQKKFDDGTLYREISSPDCDIIIFRQCQYWGAKEECKYCDINENARVKHRLGQVGSLQIKKVEQVVEVVEEILLREQFDPDHRPFYVHINGGSILREVNGMDEFQFYIRYVEAIRERVSNRIPILFQTQPWPKEMEKRAAAICGNVYRSSNLEVWDKNIFARICPGKEAYIGWEEWVRRLLDQVEVYGEGRVIPGFVVGVEMAQPWGFKKVEEAVKSTTAGFKFLMSHGVTPRPISWCVEALSALRGHEPPPVDYFIQLDRNWFELWSHYGLEAPGCTMQVGVGLNRYPNTAAYDMALVG